METAAHKTVMADTTCSSSKDISKLPNVQLRSPDTSPRGDVSDAFIATPGEARDEDDAKDSTTVKEYRTHPSGSFVDRLISPTSEQPTPGQLQSNRFSIKATPDHAPSLESNGFEDIAPTSIDYQSLPSPPEPVVVGYVDHEFGFNVQCAYDISVMRHNFRLHKYGKYALKYKRGFTPSPLRRAYTEQQEEMMRMDATYTTDSEPSSPDPIRRAYLARQEEYMLLVKQRTIDSEPSSPSPHPVGSNGEAKDQVSESFQASDMTSKAHITENSSEKHLLQEAQVSPPPVSLPAYSDVAVDDEYLALHMTLSQFLDYKAGSKRRRDDMDDRLKQEDYQHLGQQAGSKRRRDDSDDGSEQEEFPDVVGDSIKQRQVKRIKHAAT